MIDLEPGRDASDRCQVSAEAPPSAAAQEVRMVTPTPEEVADALMVAELGGDLPRLALVCRHQAAAGLYDAAGRQRLLDSAVSLEWGARILVELDRLRATERARERG